MEKSLADKYEKLKVNIKSLGSVAVAFSGGVDSTLLVYVAKTVLGEGATAIIVKSSFIPEKEYEEGIKLANEMGIRCITVNMDVLEDEKIAKNPADRCYLCKYSIFTKIKKQAGKIKAEYVIEGSNMDDMSDYRPGMKALLELGIKSPLKEAGFFKNEIREISKELDLPTWNKPAMACLASRIAYGEEITEAALERVEAAEEFLKSFGFGQLRVRNHGNLARIEVETAEFPLICDEKIRKLIYGKFLELGYTYVSLDLNGYAMGSMNKGGFHKNT